MRTLIAVLLVALAGWSWSAEPSKIQAGARHQQSEVEQRGIESAPLFVHGEITTKTNEEESKENAKERELKAHVDADLVKYTKYLAISTFFLFLFTAALWYVTYQLGRDAKTTGDRQHEQTIKSLHLASREFIAAHRPWVSVKAGVASDLSWDDQAGRFDLLFAIKNTGNSPALLAYPFTEIISVPGVEVLDPFTPQKKIVEQQSKQPRNGFGITIFPGDVAEWTIGLSIPRPANGGEWILPTITGCVCYDSAISDGVCATGFILTLMTIDPDSPNSKLGKAIKIGDKTPQRQLRLTTGEMGSGLIV